MTRLECQSLYSSLACDQNKLISSIPLVSNQIPMYGCELSRRILVPTRHAQTTCFTHDTISVTVRVFARGRIKRFQLSHKAES